jgi:hypothetical protein
LSFNPDIPIITNAMLQSQGQIKANFQAINAAFTQNHSFSQATLGMHNLLLFREQSTDPTTNSGQIALYTKAVGTNPCLFYRPTSNQTPIQLTYPSINTFIPTDFEAPGAQYSFTAGPFVIYGGYLVGVTQGQAVTLLPFSHLLYVGFMLFPAPAIATYYSYICATNIVDNTFNIQFDVNAPPSVMNMTYFAIGQ